MRVNPDYEELLKIFNRHKVRYLVVGAYALCHYSQPRYTKDIDIWVDAEPANAKRVYQSLAEFGAPLNGLEERSFSSPGITYQIGVEPVRIDILTEITGIKFNQAWGKRVRAGFGNTSINLISRQDYIANKKAVGRLKDRADLEALGEE